MIQALSDMLLYPSMTSRRLARLQNPSLTKSSKPENSSQDIPPKKVALKETFSPQALEAASNIDKNLPLNGNRNSSDKTTPLNKTYVLATQNSLPDPLSGILA
jgi:hypothetical protein